MGGGSVAGRVPCPAMVAVRREGGGEGVRRIGTPRTDAPTAKEVPPCRLLDLVATVGAKGAAVAVAVQTTEVAIVEAAVVNGSNNDAVEVEAANCREMLVKDQDPHHIATTTTHGIEQRARRLIY